MTLIIRWMSVPCQFSIYQLCALLVFFFTKEPKIKISKRPFSTDSFFYSWPSLLKTPPRNYRRSRVTDNTYFSFVSGILVFFLTIALLSLTKAHILAFFKYINFCLYEWGHSYLDTEECSQCQTCRFIVMGWMIKTLGDVSNTKKAIIWYSSLSPIF